MGLSFILLITLFSFIYLSCFLFFDRAFSVSIMLSSIFRFFFILFALCLFLLSILILFSSVFLSLGILLLFILFFLGIISKHIVLIISKNMCVHSSTFLPSNIASQSNLSNINPIVVHGIFSLWKLSLRRSSSSNSPWPQPLSIPPSPQSMSVTISMRS